MKSMRERIRNRMIMMISRSDERRLEGEWEWIEWKRRVLVRLGLALSAFTVLVLVVKFAADHTKGGRYDAWAEAIGTAQREARP